MNLVRSIFLTAGLIAISICSSNATHAEGVHAKVRKTLTSIAAEALGSESSRCPGCEVATTATGFFVDAHGTVVTSYHLLTSLGNYDPSTLNIWIVTGDVFSSSKRPAAIEYVDAIHDLLVLRTPEAATAFDYLRYHKNARARISLSSTPVLTSGFPSGYPYLTDAGTIKAFNGPTSGIYLWTTNMEFKEGQSGSPVYFDDGTLMGVVKGSEDGYDKNSFIIPAKYLASLIRLDLGDGADTSSVEALGSIQIVGLTQRSDFETVSRSENFYERNSHCTNDRNVTWEVKANNGWIVLPDSIHATATTVSSKSQFAGVSQVSNSGFSLSGRIRNSGDCVKSLGIRDGRGALGVTVTYDEKRSVNIAEETLVRQSPLFEGRPIEEKLPSGIENVRVTFKDARGNISELVGAGKQDAFRVEIEENYLRVIPGE